MQKIKNNSKSPQNGFTLIELSIALVIIALTITGVFIGKDLIQSTKIASVITDLNKYQTAINAFRAKYRYLPGDIPNAEDYWGSAGSAPCTLTEAIDNAGTGTQTCNGNSNGIIDDDNTTDKYETLRVWEHLQNAELIFTNLNGILSDTPTVDYSYEPGINIPEGPFLNSIFTVFYYQPATTFEWADTPNRHIILFGSLEAGTDQDRWNNAVITPLEAYNIDRKLDDGKPYLGRIQDMIDVSGNPGNYTPDCTDTEVKSTAKYNTILDDVGCVIVMDLDL